MSALQHAVEIAGSQSELARRIGVSHPRVWNWLHRPPHRVPAEFAIAIEQATGVTRDVLRPDIVWGIKRSEVDENKK